ncbi:MAG TPA: ATP-binding protein [Vicinamibacterales bacterium]|nr:ATP-binding protein [Vicinamibacterales bacterium]
MPFSLKTKQVAAVTVIVGLAVILVSLWYASSLITIWLGETKARAELITNMIQHRMLEAANTAATPEAPTDEPLESRVQALLAADAGLQSIVAASQYADNVLYAAIVDRNDRIIIHSDPGENGRDMKEPVENLETLLDAGPIEQARAIYTRGGKEYEYRNKQPLLIGDPPHEFATIRVRISTLLIRGKLEQQMRTPLITSAVAIALAVFVAMLLAQLTLRPIHMIRTGLARLGRGELDVKVDLPEDAELADLGDSFKAVSARLAADREELEGQRATLESVVDNLEDAVALFSPTGMLLFANPAMQPVLNAESGPLDQLLPPDHPYRVAVESALSTRASPQPANVQVPGGGQRLVVAHPVEDADGDLLGVMLVARNLTYLSQVESTLNYSRKLAALSRLSAGIAHEVKNPLNATMIHLELLKMQLSEQADALEHVAVIAAQVRRLDEVVQGFLKFTRPEELQLQPVDIPPLIEQMMPIVSAEASKHNIDVRLEFAADLPPASADSGLLQQAFLNLALNACQAMPNGGKLRIAATRTPSHQIAVVFEDTGVGIAPEHLARIFDLYFTTKEHGSGIGLSLVYRTIQLHDGEIEVQSAPGRGTTFRVLLREAPAGARRSLPGILGLHDDVTPGSMRSSSAS